MKNKILLVIIILFAIVSNIFPQQKFRKAIFLHRSVGSNIYGLGQTTNVPNEAILYNTAHTYIGADSVYMDEVLFP